MPASSNHVPARNLPKRHTLFLNGVGVGAFSPRNQSDSLCRVSDWSETLQYSQGIVSPASIVRSLPSYTDSVRFTEEQHPTLGLVCRLFWEVFSPAGNLWVEADGSMKSWIMVSQRKMSLGTPATSQGPLIFYTDGVREGGFSFWPSIIVTVFAVLKGQHKGWNWSQRQRRGKAAAPEAACSRLSSCQKFFFFSQQR